MASFDINANYRRDSAHSALCSLSKYGSLPRMSRRASGHQAPTPPNSVVKEGCLRALGDCRKIALVDTTDLPRIVVADTSPVPVLSPTSPTASTISASSSLALLSPSQRQGDPPPKASPSAGISFASSPTCQDMAGDVTGQRLLLCAGDSLLATGSFFDSDSSEDGSQRSIDALSPESSELEGAKSDCGTGHRQQHSNYSQGPSLHQYDSSGNRVSDLEEYLKFFTWTDPSDSKVLGGDAIQSPTNMTPGPTAREQSAGVSAPLFRRSSYFTPWELRDKAVGCVEHGPDCIRQIHGAELEQRLDVLGTPQRKYSRSRITSEPYGRRPIPDKRMSSIAEGVERNSYIPVAVRERQEAEAQASLDRVVEAEARLQTYLGPEFGEILDNLERNAQPCRSLSEHYFWAGDPDYFQDAVEEVRRSSNIESCHRPSIDNSQRPANRTASPSVSICEESLGSPVWRGIKLLARKCFVSTATILGKVKSSMRRFRHWARHRFFVTPCTDECFADAFERASLLEESEPVSRNGSYGALGYSSRRGTDFEQGSGVGRLRFRICRWTNRLLDGLDGSCKRRHTHQAILDPMAHWNVVKQVRKQRHDAFGRRSNSSYR